MALKKGPTQKHPYRAIKIDLSFKNKKTNAAFCVLFAFVFCFCLLLRTFMHFTKHYRFKYRLEQKLRTKRINLEIIVIRHCDGIDFFPFITKYNLARILVYKP